VSDDLRRELTDGLKWGCHGIVIRDGCEDACGKPATVIIDGRGTEDEEFWPACTYHGNRYGDGRVVPLVDIVAALRADA
jgi:hypothetical protein